MEVAEVLSPAVFTKKKISLFSQRLFEMSLKQIREQEEEEEGNLQDVMEELTCRFLHKWCRIIMWHYHRASGVF